MGDNSVVVDGTGHLGMGVGTTPEARIDVLSHDTLPFLHYSNADIPNSTLQISKEGRVGISTTAPTTAELYVNGTTQTNTLITSSVISANAVGGIQGYINFNQASLSNINKFYVNEFVSTSVSSDNLSTTSLTISSLIGAGDTKTINLDQSTLSNIKVTSTTTLATSAITGNGSINMSAQTLCNVANLKAGSINVNTIDTLSGNNINFSSRTLSNVGAVLSSEIVTPSISGTGANNELSMNNTRILDVDSIVVRSNITVTMTGLNTYTNLPTDLVRIDQATGKILDQYISDNIVRLMQDGKINPTFIPVVDSGRNTLLHTRDRVGIGLRNPQQKLHVHGNQAITSGRLGIGTTNPLHALHVVDDNSGISAFALDVKGSTDIMRINGSNSTPVLYLNASCNVGIRTAAPMYNLHVAGTAYASGVVRTNALESDSGVINCRDTSLSNIRYAHMDELVVTNTVTLPSIVSANTAIDTIETNTLSAKDGTSITVGSPMIISGYDTTLYSTHANLYGDTTDFTRIGLKVDNSILARTLLTISDRRVKKDIITSDADADMNTVMSLPVKRFSFIDNPQDPALIGFIAQEVEAVAPYAVRTTSGPVPTVVKEVAIDAATNAIVLPANDRGEVPIVAGTVLKVLYGEKEAFVKVREVLSDRIVVEEPLPDSQAQIFVYGPVVQDFKLLDSERLVPLALNAIKKMYRTQQDILARLVRIEAVLGI